MRKTSFLLISAATGVALAVMATLPPIALAEDASANQSTANSSTVTNYKALDLFSDTFARVRSRYVEQPSDSKLIESAINGMLAGLEDSYYVDPKSMKLSQPCSGPGCPLGDLGLVYTVADGLTKIIT